ncbi:MAG: 3-deoxy-D-manno-octulosonic acid transferase [Cyclobacteriaceae bacterium]|nr:3-deoxy-D-manno-octulosonic acid transferase [Cyclobacteriaceae bacterium]
MRLFYTLFIVFLDALYRFATLFNAKARLLVNGRKDVFTRLQEKFRSGGDAVVWVHCASLGEFEQGRPLIEALHRSYPTIRILLTFYSPSGYEVRKNYELAYHVDYLPSDTPSHARRLLELVKPSLTVFVKYEFWPNYFQEINRQQIPLLSISALFRADQLFFRWYGGFFLNSLHQVSWFFVQNESSKTLLQQYGLSRATVAGDTRFDRVQAIIKEAADVRIATRFAGDKPTWVIGSCWMDDLTVLAPFINENQHRIKFILAPHEIDEDTLLSMERQLQVKHLRYSQAADLSDDVDCLLIDNIGLLSRLYRYGNYAYVGGAFGKGLHNILEAACYGVPVFFGNRNYKKYNEATELILRGGAFEVADYADFRAKVRHLEQDERNYELAAAVTRQYVVENLGATGKIMDYCHKILQDL